MCLARTQCPLIVSLGEVNKCYAKVANHHAATKGIFSTWHFEEVFAALEELYNNWFKMFSLLVSTG